jgi:pSer/pThr/pTyr-binding forkhead associated (FHA) protein
MKISVQVDFEKTLDVETPKFTAIVGRAPTCDMVIAHESISRQHCQIEAAKGVFYITDLGSSNGTFINGKRLEPKVKASYDGSERLRLGKLNCEISHGPAPVAKASKALSSTNDKGQFTATTRISRLDLKDGVMPTATELANRVKPKGPRNPITDELQNYEVEVVQSKRIYIILFLIVSVILAWLTLPIFT